MTNHFRVPLASCILLAALYHSPLSTALQLTAGQRIAPRPGHRIDGCKSLFNLPAVEQWATERNLKEHHLKTLYRTVMSTHPNDQDKLERFLLENDFPRKHASDLLQNFQLCTLQILEIHESKASGGKKLVIQLPNKQKIETVLIRHETSKQVRYTVCFSSQVGCARACTFCATGTMNLMGNLSGAEILQQVYLAGSILHGGDSIRNCVAMGMGEPFDNYNAVHEACRGLTHQCLFGLASKHVTISTVGASPRHVRLLADECPQVSLALSLHGATQELRRQLMPQSAPLNELEEALDYHAEQTGQRVMMEYLLIDGVNDGEEAANALIAFCKRRKQLPFVNIIPYNPNIAGVPFHYTTPSDESILAFHNRLLEQDIRSIVRWTSAAGRDTNGACGQLVVEPTVVR